MTQPSAPVSRSWQDRFSLRDRVVLLTGAAGGIGSVFAWALAEAGAIVAATDRSMELLAPLGHLLHELLFGEGDPQPEIDEHVGHGPVPRALPVPRVGDHQVLLRVVHVAGDVEDRPLG